MTKVYKTTYKPINITRKAPMGQMPLQGYLKWGKCYFSKTVKKIISKKKKEYKNCHNFTVNTLLLQLMKMNMQSSSVDET